MVSPHLQDVERGGGGRGQPASLLTRSAACPPRLSQMLREGLPLQHLRSPSFPVCLRRDVFGGVSGEGTEPDAF